MLTVKRNHFYKKKEIETGVNVKPQYADLPSSTASTAKLGTNRDQNIFVLGTKVPELPDYGDAEQVGAAISLYASAIEAKDNRNVPDLYGMRISEDIELNEGGISLSSKGSNPNSSLISSCVITSRIVSESNCTVIGLSCTKLTGISILLTLNIFLSILTIWSWYGLITVCL